MGLFDALFGLASAKYNQNLNVGASKELQAHQAQLNYDYSQKYALNSPDWNRQGLINAGYNPMLAVQNGVSGSNASWTSANNMTGADVAGDIQKFTANAQNYKRLENETKVSDANTDAAYANADKAKAEKATLLERMPWISKREKAEIGNIEKDSMKKEAEIHNIDETTRYISKRFELDKMLGEMGLNIRGFEARTNARDVNSKVSNGYYDKSNHTQLYNDVKSISKNALSGFSKSHPRLHKALMKGNFGGYKSIYNWSK